FPALRGFWWSCMTRGAVATARDVAEQLLRVAQREATPATLLEAYNTLGLSCHYLGDYAAARTHFEQAIACSDIATQRTAMLRYGIASGVQSLAVLALTLWCLGAPAQAQQRSQEALALAQELGHPPSLGFAQLFAAHLHYCRRDLQAVQAQ